MASNPLILKDWRRGWDSNPVRLLIIRNLLISRKGRNVKIGQHATLRYTAGTRAQVARQGKWACTDRANKLTMV